jgi:8-oxo-dGTP pyrophosphatase MutT (NUDIX family)
MNEHRLAAISTRLASADLAPELPPDLRKAAVLVIMFELNDELKIPLIERSHGRGVHSGQLALPGGAMEAGDRTLLATALREAHEEVGADPSQLRILGRLPSVVVRVSRFVVAPFVAWAATEPHLFPNDGEVARIVTMPVSLLTDPETAREIAAPPGSLHKSTYEFALPEGRLWGATARILYGLGDVLRTLR